nr:MAG TPA: hypothetical protein [Caudoviricetes sp.]
MNETGRIQDCIYCHSLAGLRKCSNGGWRFGCLNYGCDRKPHFFVVTSDKNSCRKVFDRIINLWNSGDFVSGNLYVFDEKKQQEPEPHIYRTELAAWLDGRMIQYRNTKGGDWTDYDKTDRVPKVDSPKWEWRVKPERKVLYSRLAGKDIRGNLLLVIDMASEKMRDDDNVKMTFYGTKLVGVELLAKDRDNDSIYD